MKKNKNYSTALAMAMIAAVLSPVKSPAQNNLFLTGNNESNIFLNGKSVRISAEASSRNVASFFGNFNAGFSSLGAFGRADLVYKKANRFLSAGYSKSHICYLDIEKGVFSPTSKASENHITVQSVNLRAGTISSDVLFLSVGLSLMLFYYEHTLPMTNILSVESVWQNAIGESYGQTNIRTSRINAIGIPVEARFNLSPQRFAGLNMGIMINLNTEKTIVGADIGIRLGRITRKALNKN